MNLDVVYLDNHLLIVNKPANLLTQETNIEIDSLENRAKAWLKERFKKKGDVFLGVVHRLDKDVSGLVVFARTSKALSRLNLAFRKRQVKKMYHALVEGTFEKQSGTLQDRLAHGPHRSISSEEGKEAELYYEVIEEMSNTSYLRIHLKTGRYHQIRKQFGLRKHPVVGDTKYGSTVSWPKPGIALHHAELLLIHPTLKEWLTAKAAFEIRDRLNEII